MSDESDWHFEVCGDVHSEMSIEKLEIVLSKYARYLEESEYQVIAAQKQSAKRAKQVFYILDMLERKRNV